MLLKLDALSKAQAALAEETEPHSNKIEAALFICPVTEAGLRMCWRHRESCAETRRRIFGLLRWEHPAWAEATGSTLCRAR